MLLEAIRHYRRPSVFVVASPDDHSFASVRFAIACDEQQGNVSQFELDRWADDGGAPARDQE